MLLVESIDNVVKWLAENVCSQIQLKLPDDYRNDADYDVKFVNPAAFPLYVPGKDRLPPNVPAPIPSVCVQLMEGNDDLIKRQRRLNFRLCLACCIDCGDSDAGIRENTAGKYFSRSPTIKPWEGILIIVLTEKLRKHTSVTWKDGEILSTSPTWYFGRLKIPNTSQDTAW